jgi:hypothetical protein
MTNSIYKINKGINQPVEFKGLKAQYIGWLGGGIVALLLLFVLLYLIGVNSFLCLAIIGILGAFLFIRVFKMSHDYGEHGLKKKMAARYIPKVIHSKSRKIFMSYGTKL